jgi:hypothetical protein
MFQCNNGPYKGRLCKHETNMITHPIQSLSNRSHCSQYDQCLTPSPTRPNSHNPCTTMGAYTCPHHPTSLHSPAQQGLVLRTPYHALPAHNDTLVLVLGSGFHHPTSTLPLSVVLSYLSSPFLTPSKTRSHSRPAADLAT